MLSLAMNTIKKERTTMKKEMGKFVLTLSLITVLLTTFSGLSFAAAEKKMGTVDIGKVFDEYEKTKKFDQEFQLQGRGKQEERDALVHDLRKLRDEQVLLSDEKRPEKQKAVEAKMKELESFDEDTRKALAEKRNEAVKVVFQDIENTVKQYGERKGYDFIFSDRATLYHNKGFNITADILIELNQK